MSEVLPFTGITRLDLDPDQMLQRAMGELDSVIVIGYTKGDDSEEYFASSIADGGTCVWLLQRSILKLLQSVDE